MLQQFRNLLFESIVMFLIAFVVAIKADAGTLSCYIRTSSCDGGETEVLRMYQEINSHAEKAGQSNYNNIVCCSGITGLGNSCSGNFGTVLKLSGVTNAHVEENSYTNYATSSCLSASIGDSIAIGYKDNDCSGYDTTIASISGGTNAHIGTSTAYARKVCATAYNAVISVSVSDGIVTYGTLTAGASDSTVNLTDQQVATNDGNVTETFNIKGQDASGGGCSWTLAGTNGTNQYVHEFSTDGGSGWTPLTSEYQTLNSGNASSSQKTFDLRLTTPSDSTCFGEQSANVTVQAVME